jgi:hypothetical protein
LISPFPVIVTRRNANDKLHERVNFEFHICIVPGKNKTSTTTVGPPQIKVPLPQGFKKEEVPKVVSMNAETTFYLFQSLMGANHLTVHRGLPWKKLSF